ncbi:hypothetical protein [Streptomyces sp. NPDC058620]|uniref:hypothetical protein n=1 Tax=Streptomyces sp. NPDC058620 TaxID=3346560 RepID=UPI00366893B0
MDAATIGAIGTIGAGLAVATAAWIGHRGSHQGVVMTGYGGLLDRLHAERLSLEAKLTAAETALATAYVDKAQLQAEIELLEAQIADRDRQIAALRRTAL